MTVKYKHDKSEEWRRYGDKANRNRRDKYALARYSQSSVCTDFVSVSGIQRTLNGFLQKCMHELDFMIVFYRFNMFNHIASNLRMF